LSPEEQKSDSIFIIAGEASGDLHGSMLVRAYRELDPQVRFHGIGGRGLEEAGVRLLF
jgi:lipid-A-disaccharide synthase